MAVDTTSADSAGKGASATLLWKAGRLLCRLYTTLGFDLKVYGMHHIPQTGGALVVSNHQSYLDPVLLGVQLRRPWRHAAQALMWLLLAAIAWYYWPAGAGLR
jgi:1-acyl-sn-glycerol-3-phosphate acyltransferase